MAVSGTVQAALNMMATSPLDLSSPQETFQNLLPTFTFTDGVGALKVQQQYSDTITLADGASIELNIGTGILTDAFGNFLALTKLKILYLKNKSADATLYYGHTGDAFAVPLMLNAGDGGRVGPGGIVLLVWAGAAGISTSGDAVALRLEHDGTGSDSMDVDIYIAGETT